MPNAFHTMDLALPYTMEQYFVNPNPDPNYAHSSNLAPSSSDFMLSDYLILDDIGVDNQESWSQSTESSEKANYSHVNHGLSYGATSKNNNNIKCRNVIKRNKTEMSSRIAFRTRSELEIMDDGYKWRKYGKKSVKNSPNLRNYYKCSFEGCGVKKTVERDRDDSSYVITTYDSVHNHETPFSNCYTQISSFLNSDS